MSDLKNTTLNDILWYVSSARNSLTQDKIIVNSVAFYKSELIKKSKDLICKIANERNVVRKSCQDHPNPASADMKDILVCFELGKH